MEKKAWRIMLKTLYASVPPEEREAMSRVLCARLSMRLGSTMPPRMLAAYQPRLDEPDIRPFLGSWLKSGGRLCFPRCVTDAAGQPALLFHEVRQPDRDLMRGSFGLLEPLDSLPVVSCESMDVMLVPGAAFDRSGGRLGHGKGYYDRFLANCTGLFTLAPAFPWQVVERVPQEPHDIRIQELITPEGIVRCGGASGIMEP